MNADRTWMLRFKTVESAFGSRAAFTDSIFQLSVLIQKLLFRNVFSAAVVIGHGFRRLLPPY